MLEETVTLPILVGEWGVVVGRLWQELVEFGEAVVKCKILFEFSCGLNGAEMLFSAETAGAKVLRG